MKTRLCIAFSLVVVFGVAMLGCQGMMDAAKSYNPTFTKVPLDHYVPTIAEDLDVYRGKRVYLMNFDNQANDTTTWRYYSPDRKFGYIMNDTLHNYFWYAFRDAFLKKGMLVSSVDNPDPNAPAMWVTLLSITDEQYRARVTVQKRGITEFTENYTIQEPPLDEKDRTPPLLEQRAYRMTNRLIETILKDTNFRKMITAP
jgi:hypothetical protein